ncbi:MAG: TAT-variant-translocated molybdopterin oxidoreductase, partial [Candidatus Methylomirabilis sp.]|nr:TAT-variant-translocated molybdopterin oxidoreductase [Deltaproteobacteria bacterium]
MDSKTYWRSLAERAGDPAIAEALEREFIGENPEEFGEDADGTSRRRFLQIMGASFAMAGLAGCRWPKETILPFSKNPPGTVPGAPKHYATAMDLGGVAQPVVVTSYEGRPIKIEGNDAHPLSQGAAKTYVQASVLELYDPDRSRGVLRRDGGAQKAASWDDFVAYAQGVVASAKERGGAGLRVLSEASSSPSLQAMREKLLAALPQARWHEYESLSRDNEREGTRLAFGRPHRALLNLERADVVACL